MSGTASTNTASFLQSIPYNQLVNLSSEKGYWLINYNGVNSNQPNDIGVQLIERNTGRVLSVPLYGIMHVDGKHWSSVYYQTGSGTLFIGEDIADIPNIYFKDLLPNALQSILSGLSVYTSSAYTYMSVLSLSTTANTIFQMPSNDAHLYTLYFSCYNAATGETDTLTINDVSGNVYYTENITGLMNQKLVLPLSYSTGSAPVVNVVASGVTSPTGKITYTIYRGVS